MAHDKCKGTWEKSKLDGVEDGMIRIDAHTGNTFTGKHLNSGAPLEATSCDGTNISFSRSDSSQRVSYRGKIVPDGHKFRIQNGRYETSPLVADLAEDREGYGQSSPATDEAGSSSGSEDQPDTGGTWESEKST